MSSSTSTSLEWPKLIFIVLVDQDVTGTLVWRSTSLLTTIATTSSASKSSSPPISSLFPRYDLIQIGFPNCSLRRSTRPCTSPSSTKPMAAKTKRINKSFPLNQVSKVESAQLILKLTIVINSSLLSFVKFL